MILTWDTTHIQANLVEIQHLHEVTKTESFILTQTNVWTNLQATSNKVAKLNATSNICLSPYIQDLFHCERQLTIDTRPWKSKEIVKTSKTIRNHPQHTKSPKILRSFLASPQTCPKITPIWLWLKKRYLKSHLCASHIYIYIYTL